MDIRMGPEGGSRILYRRSGRDMVFEFGIESQDRYTPALVSTCATRAGPFFSGMVSL